MRGKPTAYRLLMYVPKLDGELTTISFDYPSQADAERGWLSWADQEVHAAAIKVKSGRSWLTVKRLHGVCPKQYKRIQEPAIRKHVWRVVI